MELETSPEFAALAEALAKAQAVIEGASKDASNPAFRSKYATLASVWEACRKALTDNKIAVVQAPFNGEGGDIGVTTMLVHASGQWMRAKIAVKPAKFDAQGAGSAITYLRRYLLSAMVGVAPEDDDGEAAVGRPGAGAPANKQTAPVQQQKPADPAQTNREFATTARNAILAQVRAAKADADIDVALKTNAANLDMLKKDYPISYDKLMEVVAARRAEIAEPGFNDDPGDLTP
jgi:hypothetical protein